MLCGGLDCGSVASSAFRRQRYQQARTTSALRNEHGLSRRLPSLPAALWHGVRHCVASTETAQLRRSRADPRPDKAGSHTPQVDHLTHGPLDEAGASVTGVREQLMPQSSSVYPSATHGFGLQSWLDGCGSMPFVPAAFAYARCSTR